MNNCAYNVFLLSQTKTERCVFFHPDGGIIGLVVKSLRNNVMYYYSTHYFSMIYAAITYKIPRSKALRCDYLMNNS